jgi:ubiquinone/menaquinone biosynthesis C-methylase UbiE
VFVTVSTAKLWHVFGKWSPNFDPQEKQKETEMNSENEVLEGNKRDMVRKRYGAVAQSVLDGEPKRCCGDKKATRIDAANPFFGGDAISGGLYGEGEAEEVPTTALLASLGCGNPTALAQLQRGETVLDLGSGGGIDVLLSARRVGPEGFVYGLDMTDEMLALAERNRAEAGVENVRFLKGHIEEIPLPDASVDVLISNCVINLSAHKSRVLREAFRVLKPGGRFAVSDVVIEGELPAAVRSDMEAYVGCVAGALEKDEYLHELKEAGFVEASIEATRRYLFADLESSGLVAPHIAQMSQTERANLDGRIMGAFIRAIKPVVSATRGCCSDECCK